MNREIRVIDIPEFKSVKLKNALSSSDFVYLKKECFNPQKQPFIIRELKDNEIEIENTSYSGIIQLENIRLHFAAKVPVNLLYMLTYLEDDSEFYYDPDKIINMEAGQNFFDVLGKLFINKLKDIFCMGFYKSYIKKEENIKFLKGKLLARNQLKNDISKNPKLYCCYDDLTYDNLENRIILRTATLLANLIRYNYDVKSDLVRYINLMREHVCLINIAPEKCDLVQYNRLNEYYKPIIELSKLILRFYFIRSVSPGISKGFNFLVNMNKLYEDFITKIIHRLIIQEYPFLEVEKQKVFDSLVIEKKILTRPDIIIKYKSEHPIIIDAKYKRQENNADYYQVISYALAIPSAKYCFLIYPSSENIEANELTIDPERFGNKRGKIKIYSLKIDIWKENVSNFIEYIRDIKNQIRKACLNDNIINGLKESSDTFSLRNL